MGERAQEAEGKGQRWREESWGQKIWNTHTHGQGRHQKYVRPKYKGKNRNRNKQLLTSQEHISNSDDGERMRRKQKEQESNIEEDGEHGEVARLISTPPFPPLLSSPLPGMAP